MKVTVSEGRLPEMALSERDKAILDFERSWWAEPGPKELAIRQRFDLSATRYYQVLGALLESQETVKHLETDQVPGATGRSQSLIAQVTQVVA